MHVLTSPLLTDASGQKYGKSEGNAIWLDAQMTSPYAFYQYFLNVEDSEVIKLIKFMTDRTKDEVAELERAVAEEPFKRVAQKTLAADVTTLVHGEAATAGAIAASEAMFGKGDVTALDAGTLRDAVAELPGGEVSPGTTLTDALIAVGIAESRNAARRLIGDGAISVNNAKLDDPEHELSADDFLHGVAAIIKRGRKHQAAARLAH